MNIAREIIPWTDEAAWRIARSKDITSTSVSALFGLSPYLTKFELWHRLNGDAVVLDDFADNERMRWGKRLQDTIAYGIAEDKCWSICRLDHYIRLPGLRVGSSFDYCERNEVPTYLVEAKNVDSLAFKDGWAETEFGLEAPSHIELQAQHQMLVSGIENCFIVALVGGNRHYVLERHYDEAVGTRILEECEAFWKSDEPEPTFPGDNEFIARLYRYSEPGKVVDADTETADLLREHDELGSTIRSLQDNRETLKARILLRIGDAAQVYTDGLRLNCEERGDVLVKEHMRKGFRNFRIYPRSSK